MGTISTVLPKAEVVKMSMSKVDREFYSLISVLLKDETLFTDRYYEALDELKHVWRSYYEKD